MRIVIAIAVLIAGIAATLASFKDGPRWQMTSLPTESPNTRVAALAEVGAGAAHEVGGAAAKAQPDVPPFVTTVERPSEAPAAPDSGWEAVTVHANTAPAAADPATRAALARDIQIELARLGCYRGAADGQWSAATQRAASLLVSEANAQMQVAEPDFVLLSLAKSAGTEQACGPAYQIVRQDIAGPSMGLGGPQRDQAEKPERKPAWHRDRDVEALFTNPLGR